MTPSWHWATLCHGRFFTPLQLGGTIMPSNMLQLVTSDPKMGAIMPYFRKLSNLRKGSHYDSLMA